MMRSGRKVDRMPWKRNTVLVWGANLDAIAATVAELKRFDPTFARKVQSVSALGYDGQGSDDAKAVLRANTASQVARIEATPSQPLRVTAITQEERFRRQLANLRAWKATSPDAFPPRKRTTARNGQLSDEERHAGS